MAALNDTVTTAAGLKADLIAVSIGGANSGGGVTHTITFGAGISMVTAADELSAINLAAGDTLNIVGAGFFLDGNNVDRGFLVYGGTVNISNLRIQHAQALGGAGGSGVTGAGGGAGLGGGLFVATGSTVTLDTVNFTLDNATGGAGGGVSGTNGGGGGGLGGAGGSGSATALGGGGGVGLNAGGGSGGAAPNPGSAGIIPGAGAGQTSSDGFAGGAKAGGGGSSGPGSASGHGGDSANGFFGGGGGTGANAAGGFGGGGGGGAANAGGFGGGGAGAPAAALGQVNAGGAGGFGGGGGGGGTGGTAVPVVTPGTAGGGGGGAGLGGAVFVQQGGSLSITGTAGIAGSVTGGAGGGGGSAGSAFGGALFIQGNGTNVNLNPAAGQTLTLSTGIADQTGSGAAAGNSGQLVLGGAGTVALTNAAANTYSGGTSLNAGTLSLNVNSTGASSAGTGVITFGSGAQQLSLNGTSSVNLVNELKSFGVGDSIYLRGFAFAGAASAAFDPATKVLTFNTDAGAKTARLDFTDSDPLTLGSFAFTSANGGADTLITYTAVAAVAPAATGGTTTPPAPPPSSLPALTTNYSALLRYLTYGSNPPLPATVTTPDGQVLPNPFIAQQAQIKALAAQVDAGTLSQKAALDVIADMADGTTSVATLSYQFFTGHLPTKAGLDYLVSSPENPTDLNDGFYAGMSLENRYINFAVNLGKVGEGRASFTAGYGSLSLNDATAKAYAEIFGAAPDAAKLAAILTPERTSYFLSLGGDALGQKAAMVGFLLGEAAKSDLGPYSVMNENFLYDLADGNAAYGADLHIYANAGPRYVGLVGEV